MAQYVTTAPVQDGSLSSPEYGASSENWYIAWDDDKLYVAKVAGQPSEPVYIYLDIDPSLPVNGGSNANGNLNGTIDFGTTPALPMRADVRIYWNSSANYIEFKTRDGNGNWSAPNTNVTNISLGTSGGFNREMFIRWDAMPGLSTRPAAFNWLGYEGYGNNPYGIYDTTPNRISSGVNGNAPYLAYYNTITNTNAIGGSNGFGQQSYTFPQGANENAFGAINVYDFTMNSPGQYVSRGGTGGIWTIAGSLVVGAGAVYFGSNTSNFGTTTVGNVQVTGGLLDMDFTTQPMTVTKNVSLTGGTFRLSGSFGGDLTVGGDFVANGGTFQPNSRLVTFNGTGAQQLSNVPNGITGLIFDYLTFDNATGPLTLGSNITVYRAAVFTNGVLATGANTVLLDPANSSLTETDGSYISGRVLAVATLGGGGSGTNNFHGIGLSITPHNISAAPGLTVVQRSTGTTLTGTNGNPSIGRYFTVTPTTTAGLDLQLDFSYFDHELNATQAANKSTLQLFASATGAVPFQNLRGSSNTVNNIVTRDNVMDFPDASRVFTLTNAANALPVQLVTFTAQAVGNAVRLSWRTAQEINSQGFAVERQDDAGKWESLAMIASNAPGGGSYEYLDARSAAKTAAYRYYRLRQLDHDGTSTYSPLVAVKPAAGSGQPTIQLSPVPAGNTLTVSTGLAAEIRLYDMQGKLLLQAAAPDGTAAVPVAGLAAGIYMLEARTATGSQRVRFTKE